MVERNHEDVSHHEGRYAEGGDHQPDLRTPAARRADALLMVISRGVSSPGAAPKTAKAQLVVTVPLEPLTAGVRGCGLTVGEELLSATAVRRLACDADIIPAVLGGEGEVLDLGRTRRLITPPPRNFGTSPCSAHGTTPSSTSVACAARSPPPR